MTIEYQKEVTDKVLQIVRAFIDSDVIVAGGAPRNWDLGKEANDIDLYLRSCVQRGSMKRQLLKKLLADFKSVKDVEKGTHNDLTNYGGMNVPITSVQSLIIDDVLFQFIFIEPKVDDFQKKILMHMDIGLNRVGYLGKHGGFKYTEEYKEDMVNNTMTLFSGCMCPMQLKHCMTHHLPKMISYFPDYKLIIK